MSFTQYKQLAAALCVRCPAALSCSSAPLATWLATPHTPWSPQRICLLTENTPRSLTRPWCQTSFLQAPKAATSAARAELTSGGGASGRDACGHRLRWSMSWVPPRAVNARVHAPSRLWPFSRAREISHAPNSSVARRKKRGSGTGSFEFACAHAAGTAGSEIARYCSERAAPPGHAWCPLPVAIY